LLPLSGRHRRRRRICRVGVSYLSALRGA
jgi:hypothetical protein